jgi:hypothetical protein
MGRISGSLIIMALSVLLPFVVSGVAVVASWNDVALNAIRTVKMSPPVASRALAIVNVAIHDAVASISPHYAPYGFSISAPSGASLDAAVIAAAHTALVSVFPTLSATFDHQYVQGIDALPATRSTYDGVYVGTIVARAVFADRQNDGSQTYAPYPGSTVAGKWRPTPPSFSPAEVPQWANVKPWCMTSDDEFRPPPPPELNSAIYIADHNQIAQLGSNASTTRTSEQSDIAAFWYDGPATDTPPGTWDTLAEQIAIAKGFDIPDSARLFALLSVTLADCAIMGWDAKYTYGQWRPITAIREANIVVPPTTPPLYFDPNWIPLLLTPPWPDYLSDRAMFGGASSQLLTRLFGSSYSFTIKTDDGTMSRTFSSFYAAAFEQGQSRVFAGSHFNTSVMFGIAYGQKVADWAFERYFLPVQTSSTNVGAIVGGIIGGAVAIALLIVLVAYVVNRRSRSSPQQEQQKQQKQQLTETVESNDDFGDNVVVSL